MRQDFSVFITSVDNLILNDGTVSLKGKSSLNLKGNFYVTQISPTGSTSRYSKYTFCFEHLMAWEEWHPGLVKVCVSLHVCSGTSHHSYVLPHAGIG